MRRSFRNAGQICIAINRIYVARDRTGTSSSGSRSHARPHGGGRLREDPERRRRPRHQRRDRQVRAGTSPTPVDGARVLVSGARPDDRPSAVPTPPCSSTRPRHAADARGDVRPGRRGEPVGDARGRDAARQRRAGRSRGLPLHRGPQRDHALGPAWTSATSRSTTSTPGSINAPYGGRAVGFGYGARSGGLEGYLQLKHVRIRHRTDRGREGLAHAVIGIDLGTSTCKVLAVDHERAGRRAPARDYPVTTSGPGGPSRSPTRGGAPPTTRSRTWWAATGRRLRGRGIGLCGQMHGLTALDADGEVIRSAILWNDQRAAPQCDGITERAGGLAGAAAGAEPHAAGVHRRQDPLAPRARAHVVQGHAAPAQPQGLHPPPHDRCLRHGGLRRVGHRAVRRPSTAGASDLLRLAGRRPDDLLPESSSRPSRPARCPRGGAALGPPRVHAGVRRGRRRGHPDHRDGPDRRRPPGFTLGTAGIVAGGASPAPTTSTAPCRSPAGTRRTAGTSWVSR